MDVRFGQAGRMLRERLLFLKQFVTSPRHMGSVTPSSRYLVDALLKMGNVGQAEQLVELGPGTGPFTAGILRNMPAHARLLCVERDPQLTNHLRLRFDDSRLAVVTGDATDLRDHLSQHGFNPTVPLIVSGLPFTSLPESVGEAILRAVTEALTPDGDFLMYQYSTAMRSRLQKHFRSVETQWELRNIPPAVCIRCRS